MDLNELAKTVHAANAKWWQNLETGERIERNKFELLALVLSEVSEALEGERKNLMDDKLPHRKMAEVEMADAFIRLLDYAGGFGIEIESGTKEDFDELAEEFGENKGEGLFFISASVVGITQDDFQVGVAIILIQAYCAKHGYDLMGAYEEKMAFNSVRVDHSHEARKGENGKKF